MSNVNVTVDDIELLYASSFDDVDVTKLSKIDGTIASIGGTPPTPQYVLLTVNTVGNGSVTLDPPGGTYNENTEITLTSDADVGWTFDSWTGDLTGSTDPDTIIMTANKTVTAVFTEDAPGDLETTDFDFTGEGASGVSLTKDSTNHFSFTLEWDTTSPSYEENR